MRLFDASAAINSTRLVITTALHDTSGHCDALSAAAGSVGERGIILAFPLSPAADCTLGWVAIPLPGAILTP
eukprot:798620-Pleurochrysis_carterae.AAC.1